MSLEFFEPRPPKSAAIKLDFLNNPDSEVATKLRAMPGVDQVSIEYGESRTVIINSNCRIEEAWADDWWLVCTPPPRDSVASLTRGVQLEMLTDREFHQRYQPCESESISA